MSHKHATSFAEAQARVAELVGAGSPPGAAAGTPRAHNTLLAHATLEGGAEAEARCSAVLAEMRALGLEPDRQTRAFRARAANPRELSRLRTARLDALLRADGACRAGADRLFARLVRLGEADAYQRNVMLKGCATLAEARALIERPDVAACAGPPDAAAYTTLVQLARMESGQVGETDGPAGSAGRSGPPPPGVPAAAALFAEAEAAGRATPRLEDALRGAGLGRLRTAKLKQLARWGDRAALRAQYDAMVTRGTAGPRDHEVMLFDDAEARGGEGLLWLRGSLPDVVSAGGDARR
jgi:hypothetical protein